MPEGNGKNQKTLPLLIAGEGPDVIKSYPPSTWELAAKGQVLNHNELVKDLKKADVEDFHKYQWDGMVIPSTNFRYGLPTVVDMDVLYYNKELFRKRGVREPTADWGRDEYAAAPKQLTFTDGAQRVWGAKQVQVNLKLVPRKSVVDVWINAMRDRYASAARVNMKVITDALATMNYHAPNENFLCQAEAGAVIQPLLNQIFRDGTATPTAFRNARTQIETAANSCGLRFA